MINEFGNFLEIPCIEKRAKRIGLLFSNSEISCELNPEDTRDMPDVERNGHIFTDGCGLISESFAKKLTRQHKLSPPYLPSLYVPSVFQIRYKGYKGILMVAKDEDISQRVTEIDQLNFVSRAFNWIKIKLFRNENELKSKVKVIFRKSMKKFTDCPDNTFAIRSYSKPGRSAKLNTELVTLLSTNGIPDNVLIRKQTDYYNFIRNVSTSSGPK